MNLIAFALLLTMAPPSQKPAGVNSLGQPVLLNCRVEPIDRAEVPGREAGVLVKMDVREGQQVKQGEELGRIDDIKAAAIKKVKEKEFLAAIEQAEDDINVRFSKAAADVAKQVWLKSKQANINVPGTVVEIEIKKLELEYRKALLQIEKSVLDMKIAKLTSDVKSAEVEAAEADIQLRRINSPLGGVVVHVYKHLGEWVAPGDPVVQIVQVDRLRVEGFVNASEFNPSEIDGRKVTVDAELARGRKVNFTGKVVFVSPLVQPGGEYLVWAEVENKQEDGQWLLRPGLEATMTIELK